MKHLKSGFIILIPAIIGIALSCERDDICAESTSTTPSLIIDLYNADNTENKKNVAGLYVIGIGQDEALSGYEIVSVNQLVLPLRTDADSTQYTLRKNTTLNDDGTIDTTSGNVDTLTIKYHRNELYVSRACGYKTIFENLSITIVEDSDNWMKSRELLLDTNTIENETETHFKITH
ncbi:MAG: DUF6452 family protein [Flavobacteriaceae bacterium]